MLQNWEFFLRSQSVFLGGLEPSLRKVAWRIVLGVFPDRLNGSERLAFLQARSEHYYALKDKWQALLKEGKLPSRSVALLSNIKRDVLRTDRGLDFYNDATSAGQRHLVQLCELLCTFAFTHPSIGYVQGMSDMASPMLFVQEDEANAYLCFCGLMDRLAANFVDDQIVLRKFDQLRRLLSHLDPAIAAYFHQRESHAYIGTMFRWLLLELKREFDFADTLRVLEMQWAAVAAKPRLSGARLTGPDFDGAELGDSAAPVSPKDSLYLRLCLSASAHSASTSTAAVTGNGASEFGHEAPKANGEAEAGVLPPPGELGLGNPFLLFLCVSLLVEYRDALLCADNEDSFLSVFFRKLGRRHNVTSVVNRASDLYAGYLREQRGPEEFPMIEMSL